LNGDEHEGAAASGARGRGKEADGSDGHDKSSQQPSLPGPATNLIRVKASSGHEPRKSRIRALARTATNYKYLFGLIDYY
jgi:hypothetical protein